jgi:hypothetical protein
MVMDEIKDVIKSAYFAQVSQVYKVFSLAFSDAGDNQDEVKATEEKFSDGLDHAKKVYQRALALSLGFGG